MKHILFLDIDGVLNSTQQMMAHYRLDHRDKLLPQFDLVCVNNLLEILVECPDVKVVLSSSWRRYPTLIKILHETLTSLGIPMDRFVGHTPCPNLFSESGERGHEIQAWLDQNPGTERFVILDDDQDMVDLTPHLVRTNTKHGLTLSDAERVISKFRG